MSRFPIKLVSWYSRELKEAGLKQVKGDYQRGLVEGDYCWSGSDLGGKARKFGSEYKKSRKNLLERWNENLPNRVNRFTLDTALVLQGNPLRFRRRLIAYKRTDSSGDAYQVFDVKNRHRLFIARREDESHHFFDSGKISPWKHITASTADFDDIVPITEENFEESISYKL
jgi:hypothetical protein